MTARNTGSAIPAHPPQRVHRGGKIAADLRAGFILLEVMLATAIFALVVVALSRCLTQAMDAAVESQRENEIRLNLQARLMEGRQRHLEPGRELSEPDSRGITYEKEVQLLELTNRHNQALPGLYQLTVRASWKRGQSQEQREANIYVYQP